MSLAEFNAVASDRQSFPAASVIGNDVEVQTESRIIRIRIIALPDFPQCKIRVRVKRRNMSLSDSAFRPLRFTQQTASVIMLNQDCMRFFLCTAVLEMQITELLSVQDEPVLSCLHINDP